MAKALSLDKSRGDITEPNIEAWATSFTIKPHHIVLYRDLFNPEMPKEYFIEARIQSEFEMISRTDNKCIKPGITYLQDIKAGMDYETYMKYFSECLAVGFAQQFDRIRSMPPHGQIVVSSFRDFRCSYGGQLYPDRDTYHHCDLDDNMVLEHFTIELLTKYLKKEGIHCETRYVEQRARIGVYKNDDQFHRAPVDFFYLELELSELMIEKQYIQRVIGLLRDVDFKAKAKQNCGDFLTNHRNKHVYETVHDTSIRAQLTSRGSNGGYKGVFGSGRGVRLSEG